MLILIVLVAVLRGANTQSIREDEKSPYYITFCLVENWEDGDTFDNNVKSVMACIDCMREIGDLTSAAGIPAVKSCMKEYLPKGNEACSKEVGELKPNSEESGKNLLLCALNWVTEEGATFCAERSKSTDTIEFLTDGVFCMQEGSLNNTWFRGYVYHLDAMKNSEEIKDNEGSSEDKEPSAVKDYVFDHVIPMASCTAANSKDTSRLKKCKACFNANNGFRNCSERFLMPYFQGCSQSINKLSEGSSTADVRRAKNCFGRGIVRELVSTCNPILPSPNVAAIINTMDCARNYVGDWARTNLRPNMVDEVINFFNEGGDFSIEESLENCFDDPQGSGRTCTNGGSTVNTHFMIIMIAITSFSFS